MRITPRPLVHTSAALVLGLALLLGGCGDDGDSGSDGAAADGAASDGTSTDDGATADDTADLFGSVDDSDLLVPRAYLQGVWCDSDGATWTIDGDVAMLDDGAGGTGEFPLALLFIDGPDESVVTQTDDEFVVRYLDEDTTFTRGAC